MQLSYREILRCITIITEDTRETTVLFLCLSVALQRGNVSALTLLRFSIHAYRFYAVGNKNNNNNICECELNAVLMILTSL